jgi:hypothetical protein
VLARGLACIRAWLTKASSQSQPRGHSEAFKPTNQSTSHHQSRNHTPVTINVRELQPVRARMARRQRAVVEQRRWGKPVGRTRAIGIRSPPGECTPLGQRPAQSTCARLDRLLHHRLASERVERVRRRRTWSPVLQDRDGPGAAASHDVLRRPPAHRRDRRLGGLAVDRGDARPATATGAANVATHRVRPRVRPTPFFCFCFWFSTSRLGPFVPDAMRSSDLG